MRVRPLLRIAAPVSALALVAAGCSAAGDAPRVAALVPEEPVDHDAYPTILIAWCASMPEQIDIGDHLRIRARTEFEDHLVQVDLSAPGNDWSVQSVDRDGQVDDVDPFFTPSPYRGRIHAFGVGSESSDGGDATEHDLGLLQLSTDQLAEVRSEHSGDLPLALVSETHDPEDHQVMPLEDVEPDC